MGTDQKENRMKVALRTSAGDIVLELDSAKAPKTVENFVNYVKAGHYDGTIFHRVIKDFMIQGGGFDSKMGQKPTQAPIKNEANNGLKNVRGSIAMARTNDPHSASAQFFINTVDNAFLNFSSESSQGWGYAVFGQVVEGLDVVDKIRAVKTGRAGMHADVPVEAVTIDKAEVIG
jgi:peptidyl-prolyl cis-trans isomerase B (cyclophilin B)